MTAAGHAEILVEETAPPSYIIKLNPWSRSHVVDRLAEKLDFPTPNAPIATRHPPVQWLPRVCRGRMPGGAHTAVECVCVVRGGLPESGRRYGRSQCRRVGIRVESATDGFERHDVLLQRKHQQQRLNSVHLDPRHSV